MRDKKCRFIKGFHSPTEWKKGEHSSPKTEFKKGHCVPKGKDSLNWKGGISQSYYRRIAEEHLGRKLKKNEGVHHIDMDKKNNNCNNYFVYEEESNHTKLHHSVDKLIAPLMKKEIIGFEDGEYFIR